MATTDDLKFQEFDEAADLLASSPDATTRSVTEGARQDHATLRMGADSEGEDDTDQTELLSGQKKSASFWTFQYYQDFFEIDTYQVLDRIRASLLPIPGKNFVRHHLRNNPDLYGPFWICATLVFTVTIMGNLATFLQKQGSSDYHYSPQFHKGALADPHRLVPLASDSRGHVPVRLRPHPHLLAAHPRRQQNGGRRHGDEHGRPTRAPGCGLQDVFLRGTPGAHERAHGGGDDHGSENNTHHQTLAACAFPK
ncbi:protein YIPF2 isoform X2 [Ascaphus truei]|uniref:protein YIPF2 isoform X2 n=1 Tax=Ascaphus truei TaxID=8439 RepID=UPI003F590B69